MHKIFSDRFDQVMSYNGSTGVLVLYGDVTPAQYSALLGTLQYENELMVDIYNFRPTLSPRYEISLKCDVTTLCHRYCFLS